MGQTIQSLERGLRILDILGRAATPLGLNEIAAQFSINRSSVFRLISTLVQCGYVTQDPENRQYSLGIKLLELSSGLTSFAQIEARLRPVLKQLQRETGQNAHLGVFDKNDMVFLAVEQPLGHLSLTIGVGNREPALYTALGRAILAFLPKDQLEDFLSRASFQAHTPKSLVHRDEVIQVLDDIRQSGLAVDDEEYRSGISCFSAPVFDGTGQVVYAIGISGLRDMVSPREELISNAVGRSGVQASQLLGFKGSHPWKG
ncbi:MAG: IclR family transcriptional regulator [Desulfobacterales bacterium]|nr:IclR family transcriptional regulator [Desulfobacterales bacterium]